MQRAASGRFVKAKWIDGLLAGPEKSGWTETEKAMATGNFGSQLRERNIENIKNLSSYRGVN